MNDMNFEYEIRKRREEKRKRKLKQIQSDYDKAQDYQRGVDNKE
jgi:hypothetical protein